MPGNCLRQKTLPTTHRATPEIIVRRGRKPDPNARDKLLKAAAVAFMERGYSGASIDDVANSMGVTKGFVYHQYESKSELYFAVQEAAIQQIDAVVRPKFESGASPDRKLEHMALAHVRAVLANFPAAKVGVQGLERSLMRSAGPQEQSNLKCYIAMRNRYEAMFADVINAGIEEGCFRAGPVGLLTKGVLGALNWVTLWFDPDRATTQTQIDAIAHTLAAFTVQGLRN